MVRRPETHPVPHDKRSQKNLENLKYFLFQKIKIRVFGKIFFFRYILFVFKNICLLKDLKIFFASEPKKKNIESALCLKVDKPNITKIYQFKIKPNCKR